MKTCTKCGEQKSETEFHFRSKKKGTRKSYCRPCYSKYYYKEYYNANKDAYRKRTIRAKRKRKDRNQKFILGYLLKNPCVDCGETDIVTLDFDHKRDKKHNVSNLMRHDYSLEQIEKEIAKCEVRCANCHRRKTAKEQEWYKHTKPQ